MKKIVSLLLALTMVIAMAVTLAGCGEDPNAKSEGVMTYDQYMAAKVDDKVVIEAYVMATQSWWDNKITVYAQDGEGAYFIYDMKCSNDDSKKLTPGTKIKVTGTKAEWAGEIEIMDATFEIVEGNYEFKPYDITDKLADKNLVDYQNRFVSFKGMKIEAYDETGAAFKYKSGSNTDDIYFKASVNGTTVEFCIEYYLTNETTDVYKAVEALKVGDTVNMEGFLYWYNGPNPHITSVEVVK